MMGLPVPENYKHIDQSHVVQSARTDLGTWSPETGRRWSQANAMPNLDAVNTISVLASFFFFLRRDDSRPGTRACIFVVSV